jgi:hypothetical protein
LTTLALDHTSYHQDTNGAGPTLNSSTARTLLFRTPAHAKAEHPRLTDSPVKRDSPAMDMGTAIHQILLKDDRIEVGEYPDFKTKDAREWRDEVREQGRVPMLAKAWDEAQTIAGAVREQVAGLNATPKPFTGGLPEQYLSYQDSGADCRALIDWLHNDHATIDDLKTTGITANPYEWARKLFNTGFDVQAAFYVRAVEQVYGVTPVFRWVVVETKPPYPVSILTLSDEAMFAARVKVDTAISIWNTCLSTGNWPAYTPDIVVADLPGWMKDKAEDRWAEVDVEGVPF